MAAIGPRPTSRAELRSATGHFLPQAGAVWDATPNEQVFANVQKNLRQFITYGAAGLSPWSLGSQAARQPSTCSSAR
jgi:outer membrane receptor protein involved in Fe transport